jgi:hypothetical protein
LTRRAALLLSVAGRGDLSRDELNRGVPRDATKATYARVMAKTLGGQAEHEGEPQ